MVKTLNQPLTGEEIAAICGGRIYGNSRFQVSDISTDSRTLRPGALFIALRGEHFIGEDFLPDVQAKGAAAAIVQEKRAVDLPQIVVGNTAAALSALAQDRRQRSQATFFAITGSNGKTSTKEILQRLLQTGGQTLATSGNFNNEIGVPLTLLRLREEDCYAVIEMGANHAGEIARLADLVNPDVALVTNVAAAHLAGFGSFAGVIQAKGEMYAHSQAAMVVNLDIAPAADWLQQYAGRPIKTFSLQAKADITATDIAADGHAFTLCLHGQKYPVVWQLSGRHNIANALAACAAADFAGISGRQMQSALTGLTLRQSRLSAYQIGIHTVYDDTYNANPASFKAAVDVLAQCPNPLLIAGAMAELGAQSAALHREVAAYAGQCGIRDFWAVGAGQAQAYLPGFTQARYFADIQAAGRALQERLRQNTPQTVLVKGSRSAHMERIFAAAGIDDQINKKG